MLVKQMNKYIFNNVLDYCNSYKEELKLWKSEKQKSKK